MKVAYIFPPPWNPKCPSYAMGLFAASTKICKHDFFGFDLNVDLFNTVSEADKELWNGQNAMRWNLESEQIIHRHAAFLADYTADMLNLKMDLYAISVNVHSLQIALFVAKTIRESSPNASIILGGPQCFPGNHHITLLESQFVDAICTGEGDLVWPKVLDHFAKQGNLRIDTPGIAYKTNDGTIIDGGIPELVEDLNGIPFADYSGIDFGRYGNVYHLSTMTSRGCINTCAFCADRPNSRKYRHRSADNIFQEVERHLEVMENIDPEHDVPHIHFNDSLINGAPRELERFCDMVIESGVTFHWEAGALIRKEMTEELLMKMKKAGCYHLGWGLESGCQEVLNLMHKRFFTIDLAKEVIKRTHDCGIEQSICLIAGFPGETEMMFQETLHFVRDYQKYFSNVFTMPLLVVPNSLVYDEYQEFGLDFKNAREYLKWQSSDGSNTYEIREKRLEILRSVLKEKAVALDGGLRPDTK
jgi:anaerobic magnesium-protoporphyrin IX monomethyl ester cyclase